MTLHPVYTRCSKKADVAAFTKEILVKCGDIHELTYCSWTCTQALQSYADHTGCCWETVMQGYEALDANAALAWRNWQGTASGKCGVTFHPDTCGDSMGEKSFNDLETSVKSLRVTAEQNAQIVNELESAVLGSYSSYGGYGSYYKSNPTAMAAPPAKIGKITVDETIDFPNDGRTNNQGDVNVPVEKIEPPMYASRGAAPPNAAAKKATPPHAAKKARVSQLYNAYDDYRNYQNGLRLKAGYDHRFKGLREAGMMQPDVEGKIGGYSVPGESWQD